MELSRATRNCTVEALGAGRDGGAPAPRASEVGADWTRVLGFADPLANAVACVDCFVGAIKLGDGAGAASKLNPAWLRGIRAPALIAPLAPWAAKIAVDGTAA